MKHIAIVGCGPRGLSSLENLMASIANLKIQPQINGLIFEPEKYPGAGKVWDLDQVTSNWMNISDRALQNLKGREPIKMAHFTIPAFPSYIDWMKTNHNHKLSEAVDQFPPRSVMGAYLNARFHSIFSVLESHNIFKIVKAEVKEINCADDIFYIIDEFGKTYKSDECLLTIGHQSTYDDDQIKNWKKFSEASQAILIDHPYNSSIRKKVDKNHRVAIRGFGLAMIDVVRMLTIEKGASFKSTGSDKKLTYISSINSIKSITAFSLDGLPMVPKPLGHNVDQFFEVPKAQKQFFRKRIDNAITSTNKPKDIHFLLNAFAEIAAPIYLKHPAVSSIMAIENVVGLIEEWLHDMTTQHALILEIELPIVEYMQRTVDMATGKMSPSLDFAVGQIWRHLQPTMYALFSHCSLEDEVMEAIIELDESTKRYSYGPPVESIRQLIALTKNNFLNLAYARDPKIKCVDSGWELSSEGKATHVNVMINSVLDPPKLVSIDSGLIVKLKNSDLLSPVTSNLGVDTRKDGVVLLSKKNENVFMTMLGRNCKGSVLGVDAILECFGKRIEDWADGVSKRLVP